MNGVFLPSAGPSIKSPSTTQIQVPTLPTLPDPESFWSSPGLPSLYLLQEAKASVSAISALQSHIHSGQLNYSLPPPSNQALVPLPPIPIPSPATNTHHQPIHKRAIKRPSEKPEIPTYLYKADNGKGKGKGKSMVAEYIRLFTQNHGQKWEIQERYGGKAIIVSNREEGLNIWITLRTGGDQVGVSGVKVFIENGRSSTSRKSGRIPDLTRSDWNRGLSGILSKLDLSLGELLYRIPHFPDLLRSTCFYCKKYLKVPDGMPLYTGYLPSRSDGRRRHSTQTQALVQVDGQRESNEKTEQDDKDRGKDQETTEVGEGTWVCWHGSCGE